MSPPISPPARFHPLSRTLFLFISLSVPLLFLLTTGCTSSANSAGRGGKPIGAFAAGRPILEPEKYFAGRTRSWDVFETRSGQPSSILHTTTEGRLDRAGVLHFEQDLQFESGKTSHRSWLVRRVDAHHYTATGTGIIGVAHGEARGNVFHLDFTLDALPGNPLGHVHMSQWMYLQPDGVTLVNRDSLTKAGLTVAFITEQFRKER